MDFEGTPTTSQPHITGSWDVEAVTHIDTIGVLVSEPPLTEIAAYKAALRLPQLVLPFVIVVGVMGNILTLVTLHSRAYGPSPSTVGLTLLAVADTGYLIGNINWWVRDVFQADFSMISTATCRLYKMWSYFFRYLSPCTLAFITVERVVCVRFPITWKMTFTSRKNIIFCCVLIMVLFAFILQIPFKFGLVFWPDSNKTECNIYTTEKSWYEQVWIPLDGTLQTFLPSSIILVGNIVIIWSLRSKPRVEGDNTDQHKSITIMLVTVSIVFLLTTLPSAVFYIGDARGAWRDDTNYRYADVTLAHTTTMLLVRVNNAINFLLYCVMGTRFRNAFLATITNRKGRHKRRPDKPSSTTGSYGLTKSLSKTAETELP